MKHIFDQLKFVETLLSFSPRQLEGETRAANFIKSTLKEYDVPYQEQEFSTKIPRVTKAVLSIDGEELPCQASCFVSGKIEGKDAMVSSLIPSRFLIDRSNINFNPECPESISCSNFYFAPSLAIPRDMVQKVLNAIDVEGEIGIEAAVHTSANIFVGNMENPKTICFAHYDSINKGAVDNGSGVAVLMDAILTKPESLQDTLYIFCGNEELSYDRPTYWGYGFRAFENEYPSLMKGAEKIIAIDSLGNGPTQVTQDPNLQYLAFPISALEELKEKIFVVFGDFHHLMSVYHSDADDMSGLEERYLREGTQKLLDLCS